MLEYYSTVVLMKLVVRMIQCMLGGVVHEFSKNERKMYRM